MNRFLIVVVASVVIATSAIAAEEQQKDRARLDKIEQSLKSDVPRVLCLDNNFATGGQPSEQAFAKVAPKRFSLLLELARCRQRHRSHKRARFSGKHRAALLQYPRGLQHTATRTGRRVHSIGQRKIQPSHAH